MEKNIKIDVNELIELEATFKDKKELVKDVLFRLTTSKECDEILTEVLNDLKATELEFEQRPYLITAYETLVKSMAK